MRFTILVDMDGTIEDLVSAWTQCLNARYGTEVSPEDVTNYDMRLAYPSLTEEQIFAPLNEKDFWRGVKPVAGAGKVMKRLISEGHRVYIVTSSYYTTLVAKTENVLFKHFPFIDWKHVIVASNKKMIKGDFLIDDAPHNLIGGDYCKLLMDAPYNRNINDQALGIHRVYSWEEVYTFISDVHRLYERLESYREEVIP